MSFKVIMDNLFRLWIIYSVSFWLANLRLGVNELERDGQQLKNKLKAWFKISKKELGQIEQKLEKLLDVYLSEVITTGEYTTRKQKLLAQKVELEKELEILNKKDCLGSNWLASSFYRLIERKN